MDQGAINIVVRLDRVQLDEVRWRAVGWNSEDFKVGLAYDWLTGDPSRESVPHY